MASVRCISRSDGLKIYFQSENLKKDSYLKPQRLES